MKVIFKKLYNFIKINFSLFFCYALVTFFIVIMTSNYISNKELAMISRGFLTSNSQTFNISGSISPLELEDTIKNILPKEGAIFRNDFNNENITAIYNKNDFNFPLLIKGRFLSEDESFSTKKVAVVGQGLQHSIKDINGRFYISINETDYEVIGIMGAKYTSRLDSMIFIPLGIINREYGINGEITIDRINNYEKFIKQLYHNIDNEIKITEVKDQEVVIGSIDPSTGKETSDSLNLSDLNNNYLTSYIFLLVLISALLCIISISIYWYEQIKKETLVYSILGFYKFEVFIKYVSRYIGIMLLGSILGVFLALLFINILYIR